MYNILQIPKLKETNIHKVHKYNYNKINILYNDLKKKSKSL